MLTPLFSYVKFFDLMFKLCFLFKNKINIYLYFFFLLCILVFIEFSTTIVLADNYTVKNIKIKEQYDINFNKDKVINKGFEKGFKTLIFKIVESKDKKLFKDIPNNKILVETDAPYLSPEPLRGKSNEPSFIIHTVKFLSQLKKLSFSEFSMITSNNFFKLFGKLN